MTLEENSTPNLAERVLKIVITVVLGITILEIPFLIHTVFGQTIHSEQVNTSEIENDEVLIVQKEIVPDQFPKRTVIATGYYAGVKSTGKTPDHPAYGITFSGVKVRRDLFSTIAADLTVFPVGTILYIPDYGYGIVADTGSKIVGNKIDLYFETIDDIYKYWGKREVDVHVIKEGNGTLTEETLEILNEAEITYDLIMQE